MQRNQGVRAAIVALAGCWAVASAPGAASAEWVDWIGDAAFETAFNDNLNQTGFDAARKRAWQVRRGGSDGYR